MTFISFPNISAKSKNLEFHLEITGTPRNDFFRDQSNFVYRLYRSNRVIWEWSSGQKQAGVESLDDFPHDAWVSDQGWVVVRTHAWFHSSLLVFSPEGQIVLHRFHRQDFAGGEPGFLDTQPEDYMGDSSAGPFWAQSSLAYFTHSAGRPIWTIRTWWGYRVTIDLERAEFLDHSTLDENLARRLEIALIENVLATGVERLEQEQEKLPTTFDDEDQENWNLILLVMTATYHAGWLKAESSVPFLRRMEVLGPVYQASRYRPVCGAPLVVLPLRQIAKLSLLRIGKEPQWFPHFDFERTKIASNKLDMVTKTLQPLDRASVRDFHRLELDLTQTETWDRLGSPDFIDRDYWDYDLCSPGLSQTTRILWKEAHDRTLPLEGHPLTVDEDNPRIAQIQNMEPQWKQITMRDHHLV